MLTVEEAIGKLVSSAVSPSDSKPISLIDSLGHILSEDIVPALDVPPEDNSAMDGYAFCYADAAAKSFRLPVTLRIPAGVAPPTLEKNSVARIFTGAEMPLGADTVALQEDCHEQDGEVVLDKTIEPGANVRLKGQDIQSERHLLPAGTIIRAQEMGLLSSIGKSKISIFKPMKIGVLSTGNELVEPGNPLSRGQIYNSNRALLIGLISSMGMEPIDLGIAEDNLAATADSLKKAAERTDIIICCGGVSVGDEDYVQRAVDEVGYIDFWRVAIKPGKPIAFGAIANVPFFGLPGNPASVFVTFKILVRPFLLVSQGCTDIGPKVISARAEFDKKAENREVYLRARLSKDATGVEIFKNQSSGILSSACWGDVFVRQKVGETINTGNLVDVIPYSFLN